MKQHKWHKDEALEQDDRVYTNTNHGFILKDRHFYVENNGGIWDENFDYDASLVVYGDFKSNADKKQYTQMICNALNAQREALEQPTQEWQGLSDEETISLIYKYIAQDCTCHPNEFIEAIEQKLKEKNT